MSIDTDFCRILLAETRRELREAGIAIPTGLACMKLAMGGNNPYYEVWRTGHGLVWSGSASCAFEARANYLGTFLEEDFA